jgi:hypothetical protein
MTLYRAKVGLGVGFLKKIQKFFFNTTFCKSAFYAKQGCKIHHSTRQE